MTKISPTTSLLKTARRTSLIAAAIGIFANAASAAELTIPGTGDGIEILRAIGAVFSAENPALSVVVPPSTGSGGAIVAVSTDREVLGRVARPLSEPEKAQGIVLTPLVKIPSAFFVHSGAGVTQLTSAQIAGIYAGTITNWAEVGGADLRIKVVRREDGDSTLGVLKSSMPGWKDLALTPKSKIATTTQEAVETVRSVEGAIGFGPYTTLLKGELVVVAVDGKAPTDPDYPSAVVVGLIHKPSTLTTDAKAFIDYAVSERAQQVVTRMGGVPLTR
jgi:phosphate transport system substrate-binding protein